MKQNIFKILSLFVYSSKGNEELFQEVIRIYYTKNVEFVIKFFRVGM